MSEETKIAILETHQTTIDGYTYRLSPVPGIRIAATSFTPEEIERIIKEQEIDLLITGIDIPVSQDNHNPFPILNFVKTIKTVKPGVKILVISYICQPEMVESLISAGINGYIRKEDKQSIQNLSQIIDLLAGGGVYFGNGVMNQLQPESERIHLTPRQLEVLSLCAAYPDEGSAYLARRLGISGSTFRNILSSVYARLGVRTRASAILRGRQLGVLPNS